ncbi:type IX secretion/gliding motility protein PorT/SprT [Pontibacter flavimaris]|uniref:PorT-like protein n=1 Tax=Pontibacter flavimaris TaxID=1797110 RepID=A0A1Q5PAR7_9BACT|nr:porin family protein [Pontibacter flavimaris]OKL39350.1 PorT-like protein [Pontibacter flavimaris]
MAFTHIWHKLHLHRQKITLSSLIILALLLCGTAQAQQKVNALNKPGYDQRPVHYGFYLSLPLTKYNVHHSQEYVDRLRNGSDEAINPKNDIGFYTGLVLNVRLAEYLDARFVPGVGFYSRTIEFKNVAVNRETEDVMFETINNTMIELPVLLKYKAKRRSNYRPYIVAGVKPGIDLGKANNGTGGDLELQVEKFDLALEYGIGVDIFYPYFKFAPELRFSHGLMNQHKLLSNSTYSRSIDKLTHHNVSLIFFFE